MGKILDAIGGAPLAIQQKAAVVALDEQFAEMEAEITALRAENLHLQAQVNPLQREVDGLKKQLEIKGGLALHEDETKILKLICHEQRAMFNAEITKGVQSNTIRVRARLLSLTERGLVRPAQHWQGGVIYGLTDDGTTYVLEQGWV